MRHIWKNPILISGALTNLAIAGSTLQFFLLPHGTGVDVESWFTLFVLPISLAAFIIGVALWGRDPQHEGKKPTLWDNVGLVLSLIPLGLAFSLLSLAFSMKGLWDNG